MTTTHALTISRPDPSQPTTARYRLALATCADDIVQAQRLRYRVFATEGGAITPGPDGLDSDHFDEFCDHLIVWYEQQGQPPRAVGTYRMLPPHRLPPDGVRYSDTEFDLTPLRPLLPETVEMGRSCTSADHRNGTVISLLWSGIATYVQQTGYRYLLGCASMGLTDGGGQAAAFWQLAHRKHLAPQIWRCQPRLPFPLDVEPSARLVIPPLLKGYLRLGAHICAAPALDVDFGTADFLVLVDMTAIEPRYLRYFLGSRP